MTADASAVPLSMLFNLPSNRDTCLNYGNQPTLRLFIRMVTGSQLKIVEEREVDVCHDILLAELCKYGVDRDLLNWCRDYLTEGQQRAVVKGEASDRLTVTSGVPRGSLLGLSFFIVYINDLPGVISKDSSIALYADDSKMHRLSGRYRGGARARKSWQGKGQKA